LKKFRLISLSEGISYLLILSVTLGIISRDYVFPLGVAHGILFVGYMMLSLNVSHKQNWSLVVWLLVFFAAIVPFAFIAVEFFLRKAVGEIDASNRSLHDNIFK
jgi:integral membrane protein